MVIAKGLRTAFITLVVICAAALAAYAGKDDKITGRRAEKYTDHAGKFDSKDPMNYGGPRKCASCHQSVDHYRDIIDEVMDTVHHKLRGESNPNKGFIGGGAHGLFDQSGGTYGSSALINYAYTVGKKSDGCGACHIGKYLPIKEKTKKWTADQRDGINCLICHAEKYKMTPGGKGKYAEDRVLEKDKNGKRVWYQDRSIEAAESVGGPVPTEACLRCHDKLMGPDHFGTPYYPYNDVHSATGVRCTGCHLVKAHKIARGAMTTSMYAWERQNVEVGCRCHGNTPHKDTPKISKTLNEHMNRIACGTCHIPATAGVIKRIWAPLKDVSSGKYHDIPVFDKKVGYYKPLDIWIDGYVYDYEKRIWTKALPVTGTPTYRWFSGTANFMMEAVENPFEFVFQKRPVTNRNTPGAKIFPFKKFDNGLVMDRRGAKAYIPEEFDVKYTMLAFYLANKDGMIDLGLVRPSGLNPSEELFLYNIPMILTIDKQKYQETGNISLAANLGIGKMFKTIQEGGYDEYTEKELIEFGTRVWSGKFIGMLEPRNRLDPYYDKYVKKDPTKVTGSLFTLSHGVRPKNDALRCKDCHSSAGVMNFEELGYDKKKAQRLVSILGDTISVAGKK